MSEQIKSILMGTLLALGFAGLAVLAIVPGCTAEAIAQPPGAKFGLDPIGQAIVRGREETLSNERRIELLERQVAQLQRIIFNDPTIRPPVYRDAGPIGSASPEPIAAPIPDGDQ